jgi:pyruvate kinase
LERLRIKEKSKVYCSRMEDGRTRIVCTLGPASSSGTVLHRMMESGMDVARLNFSHGTHDDHALLMKAVRASAKKAGKIVAILQDLQGPKIRVGELGAGVTLHEGQTVTLEGTHAPRLTGGIIPVSYDRLSKDVKKGERILFDDGYLEVEVLKASGKRLSAVVKVGGVLKSHKGVNFPDSTLSLSSFTEKDKEDLVFGVEHGVDWVCLSFVTGPEVLHEVRKLIARHAKRFQVRPPLLMAKVERKAALLAIEEIIEAADGIMLGRGDLGVEIPAEEVPVIQKDVVERARLSGKPIIVATQMLESMRMNPRATRAEVSDVANAVFDHADAVMLSAESATGRYPAVSVQAMAAVIREAEASRFDEMGESALAVNCVPSALAHTISLMAKKNLIRAVVLSSSVPSLLGSITMFRPRVPIIVVVEDESQARQLLLHSGSLPLVLDDHGGTFIPRLHALIHARLRLPKGLSVAYLTSSGGGSVSLSLLPL